ncbi:hypothetical protein [Leptospira fainei]
MSQKDLSFMDPISTQLLQDIYSSTQTGGFLTMRELEIETALSEWKLRPFLEDLKEGRFIHEHPEGFQVAVKGRQFYESRWG